MNSMKRIEQVDFLRFIFALFIALFHFCASSFFRDSTNPSMRHIAQSTQNLNHLVDSFFVMAGYFLIKTEKDETTIEFIKRKFFLLFPWMLLYILLMWVIRATCLVDYDFSNVVFSLTLTDTIGLSLGNSGIAWFISVYFVVTSLYYFLIKNFDLNRVKFSVFIIVYLCYSALIHKLDGKITGIYGIHNGVVNSGILRGLAGVGAGCILAWFFDEIQSLFRNKWLNSVLELFLILFMLFFLLGGRSQLNSLIYVFSFSVLFSLFLLKRGVISTVLSVSKWHKLAKYSLGIYMIHPPVLRVFRLLISNDFVFRHFTVTVLTYEALVFISSMIAYNFITKFNDYLKRLSDKILCTQNYIFSKQEICVFSFLSLVFTALILMFGNIRAQNRLIYRANMMDYVGSKCRAVDLKRGNIVVKEFKLNTRKALRTIEARFFTWNNRYNGSLIVQVWKNKYGEDLLCTKKVNLNKIKDNELTDIRLSLSQILEPGVYSVSLCTTEADKRIAISAIKTDENSAFFYNKKKLFNEDLQILLQN